MNTANTPSTTAWTLPAGMRATKATRALAALYRARPEAALSPAEVQAALVQAGVAVNRVTVYRLLDRCAAAGLLHRQIDSARVTRYHLALASCTGDDPLRGANDGKRPLRLPSDRKSVG